MAILVIAAYAAVSWVQIRALAVKKHWKDLVVFCLFMAASFTASLLYSLGVPLPNPVDMLHGLLERLGLHY